MSFINSVSGSNNVKSLTNSNDTLTVTNENGISSELVINNVQNSVFSTKDSLGNIITTTYAKVDSPVFTGTPSAPTADLTTNTTQIATTAFVKSAISNLVNSSPDTLDTLKELASALGNDANFSTTVTNALANKQPLDATLTALSGVTTSANELIYSTDSDNFSSTSLTSFARTMLAANDASSIRNILNTPNIDSPSLTGTPTAPTAAIGTNTTQLATTAFVKSAIDKDLGASSAIIISKTILSTDWDSNSSFTITDSSIKSNSLIILSADDTTYSNVNVCALAQIECSAMATGSVTLHCAGTKPSIDIILKLTIISRDVVNSERIAIVQDQKPSGTSGGTFTAGSWQTRDLNTIVYDDIGITLSNNQITLPIGKYLIEASAPAYCVNMHHIRLRNITNSITMAVGNIMMSNETTYGCSLSTINTCINVDTPKIIELQHYCKVTANFGFGWDVNSGEVEVYAQVMIKQIG